MRPRTVVTVEQNEHGWWAVRVTYPGAESHTLVSVRDRDAAVTAARGYAIKYWWLFEED